MIIKKESDNFNLNDKDLEQVTGGYGIWKRDKTHFDVFYFNEEECAILAAAKGLALAPGVGYKSNYLAKYLGTKRGYDLEQELISLGCVSKWGEDYTYY